MKKLALATASAALALSIVAAPASAGRYDRQCGDQESAMGAPWTNLKAANVTCRAARNLADVYVSADWDGEYRNWTCRDKQLGPEDQRIRCKRPKNGGQQLKFFYGA